MKLSHINTRIHSIETGGTVDGPGIRYVVFMQGCPLKCQYCHNPDTWDLKAGTPKNLKEIVQDILKYKPFMKFSNGGVTISGGEPLLHKEFITSLFEILKDNQIHTAIDTSGYTNLDESLDKLLNLTDLVLLDIKHLDSDSHLELTGVNNHKTMAFLNHLKEKNIPTWIRWVVLTGVNDSKEYANQFADFIKNYPNIELVELLPYHNMGQYKWEKLGLEYKLKNTPEPTKDKIKKLSKILNDKDIKTLSV